MKISLAAATHLHAQNSPPSGHGGSLLFEDLLSPKQGTAFGSTVAAALTQARSNKGETPGNPSSSEASDLSSHAYGFAELGLLGSAHAVAPSLSAVLAAPPVMAAQDATDLSAMEAPGVNSIHGASPGAATPGRMALRALSVGFGHITVRLGGAAESGAAKALWGGLLKGAAPLSLSLEQVAEGDERASAPLKVNPERPEEHAAGAGAISVILAGSDTNLHVIAGAPGLPENVRAKLFQQASLLSREFGMTLTGLRLNGTDVPFPSIVRGERNG